MTQSYTVFAKRKEGHKYQEMSHTSTY